MTVRVECEKLDGGSIYTMDLPVRRTGATSVSWEREETRKGGRREKAPKTVRPDLSALWNVSSVKYGHIGAQALAKAFEAPRSL